MPTSETGTWTERRRYANGGFSLLELLVVVTIIGIFAGAAVLSVGVLGSDREIQREALRFRSLLDLLREEAVMESRDYGVLFNERGYRFYVYDHERLIWLDPIGDEFLSEHQLQGPLGLTLALEGRDVVLEPEFDPQILEQPEPQVVIFSTGEMTPFEARFYRELTGGRFVLTGALNGTLEVTQDGFETP